MNQQAAYTGATHKQMAGMPAGVVEIDFASLGGPTYTGWELGRHLRKALHLDDIDAAGRHVSIEIPERTNAISGPFFIGLFGPSVVKAGSTDAFFARYEFHSPSRLKKAVDSYASRALRDPGFEA